MKATKTMIKHEFDRRVAVLLNDVERLKSKYHEYFNEYKDRQVWTDHINYSFERIYERLDEMKELAQEWEKADE